MKKIILSRLLAAGLFLSAFAAQVNAQCTGDLSVPLEGSDTGLRLSVQESHTNSNCAGSSGTVIISASGGTEPYTGTGTFAQAPGTQSYAVTDANGCTEMVNATVSSPTPTLTCPPNMNIVASTTASTTGCELMVNVPQPTISGVCAGINATNNYNGTSNASGIYPVNANTAPPTTVTWSINVNGQTYNCSHTVRVRDLTIPNMDCLPNQTKPITNVNVPLPANMSDNCGFNILQVRRRLQAGTTYTPWYNVSLTVPPPMPFNTGGSQFAGTQVTTYVMQYRGYDVNSNYKVCQFNLRVTASTPTPEELSEAMPEPQSWEVSSDDPTPVELISSTEEEFYESVPFDMSVYPNPNEGRFWVALDNVRSENVSLNILDNTGRLIQQNMLVTKTTSAEVELDLSTLPSGVYFVQVKAGSKMQVEKIVKI